ncbi:MAG: TadE/TadG family type IV pilus assembly protein [Sphingomicrobium sp.]
MIQKLRNLAAEERGTALIELALAIPIFAAALMGMVDLSRAYSEKLQLEQAAQRAIERVMNRQMSSSSFNTLRAEAVAAAGVDLSDVTVDFWLECNSVRQSNYDSSCSSGQVYARYLTVGIQKDFVPSFGTRFFPGANNDGTFTIVSEAGIRTQ